MAATAHLLSLNAKLYFAAGGVNGGTFAEATNVIDVAIPMGTSGTDVTTRASQFDLTAPVLKRLSLQVKIMWLTSDPFFTALFNAWSTRGIIGIRALDKVSGNGPEVDMWIEDFQRNEELKERITADVTLALREFHQWLTGT